MNMGKDNIFLNDVEVPEVVWDKLDAAFLIINKERENTMKKEQTIEKRKENTEKVCLNSSGSSLYDSGSYSR